MTWMPLDSLTEWENTWVWLKVTLPDRSYVYHTPIYVCKYPSGLVTWKDYRELDPAKHTIQVINQPHA